MSLNSHTATPKIIAAINKGFLRLYKPDAISKYAQAVLGLKQYDAQQCQEHTLRALNSQDN